MSEFDQEVRSYVGGGRRDSDDLKLFVGNLSFTIDSVDLADLFGQAGTVELVEVNLKKIRCRKIYKILEKVKDLTFSHRNIKLVLVSFF